MAKGITDRNVVSMTYKLNKKCLAERNGYSLFKTKLLIGRDIVRNDYGEFVSCDIKPNENSFIRGDFWVFMKAEEESRLESALRMFFSFTYFPYFIYNTSNYDLVDKVLRENKKCLKVFGKSSRGRYVVDLKE